MSFENLKLIQEEKFSINNKIIENNLHIIFHGSIDLPDPGIVISPFLIEVHDSIIANESKEVYFDISELSYINSSGIKAIIKFIINILPLSPKKKYKVIFQYDPQKGWQPSSFRPVTMLAPKITEMIEKKDVIL